MKFYAPFKYSTTFVLGLTLNFIQHAQTFGPNNSATHTNSTSVGTFSWSNPNFVASSDNQHASVTNKGLTNYLSATNFGFSLPVTTSITGIQLDIEKSTLSPTVVTTLNGWTAGLTKTISPGSNRMLLLIYSGENGTLRDITGLTYGGQSMTQIVEGGIVTSFAAKMEYWVLLESGIAAASNTSFVPNFAAGAVSADVVNFYASAVYAGVDQMLPFTSTQIFTTSATATTLAVSPTLATTGGGMVVSAIHCGNNTTPNRTPGGTNTYSVSAGFTEVLDTYTANPTATASGICTQISQQSITAAGTVAPSYTFAGTPNRQIVIYTNLTCIRELDNSVRLVKGGLETGSNLAYTVFPWNTVDTYTSYGSSSNLWGTTWSVAEINASNFGAVLSASVSNGTARVDHMRITVTGISTLPVELIHFYGKEQGKHILLEWQTASEKQNKQFVIERMSSLGVFSEIGTRKGKGNSLVINSYEFLDDAPLAGVNYYRIRQEDFDGHYDYSKIISIHRGEETIFTVYPNPSSDGNFNLVSDQIIHEGVYIYSSDMKLIKRVEGNNSPALEISITELADGVYFLLFNTGSEQKIKKVEKFCR
ncbi:MAG: T9SS type A sorting domain-containing protein [Bacteroidia bacterium]|jgi:hypothetical protein|nr:T9SS type A sorting domain-containing protein [Bacteroidia bacterium]